MEKASDIDVLMDTLDTFWPPGPDGATRFWEKVTPLITTIETIQGHAPTYTEDDVYFNLIATLTALGLYDDTIVQEAEADSCRRPKRTRRMHSIPFWHSCQ